MTSTDKTTFKRPFHDENSCASAIHLQKITNDQIARISSIAINIKNSPLRKKLLSIIGVCSVNSSPFNYTL
jgi:hypothetical protein